MKGGPFSLLCRLRNMAVDSVGTFHFQCTASPILLRFPLSWHLAVNTDLNKLFVRNALMHRTPSHCSSRCVERVHTKMSVATACCNPSPWHGSNTRR